ncbi:MAG: hypothetical protein ABJA78_20510 [Ferruginibacter sp.]
MDSNLIYRTSFFGILYFSEMLAVYLYGRRYFPKLALQLTSITFIVLLLVTFYSAALGAMLSIVTMIVYLFKLRRPDQTKALQQFYVDNKIYRTDKRAGAAMKVLGDKNWSIAEGTVSRMNGEPVNYFFCQGYTSSYVQTGQYARTKTYTHFLAFIFASEDVSNIFKQHAMAAANKKYPFRQRLKYFFSINTEKPKRVVTAEDGSLIIEYYTMVDVEHYGKQLSWIKENMRQSYFPVSEFSTVS